ncbi:Glycosyltransferase involved in cell wall bisynthesis [Sphingomonas sp. YR710]|uniref:glycosyltransferase n=1 Tax=Sphingomonas sp. YR710 TaxID=1882773 RepID=UPI000886BD32|nr:glycosyltransferase [Sphingomonas sp. YR710]SDD18136.1 Glycosyltransferase involved in cell wall bisynthesis [Sphingomonas sp. YR710]
MPLQVSTAAHIVLVLHDFSTGGSERIAIRLANQWARSGRRVTILSGASDGPARALVAAEVTVQSVWPEIRRSILSRVILGTAMAENIRNLRPDIIFVPGNFHFLLLWALGRALGDECPAVVAKISNPIRFPFCPSIVAALLARVIRKGVAKIDSFIAMSAALRTEAEPVLERPDIKLIHEPNIDHLQEAAPDRIEGPPLILCAGRLVRQKNFLLALQAFARTDPASGAHLMILGEGDQRRRLEAAVDRLGLSGRVTLAGHVPAIRPYLRQARLFLLSSRYEGYPAVLIEALAERVPIVATDCSAALGEIIAHPSFGRIVPQNAAALGEAIDTMLDAPGPEADQVAMMLRRHQIDRVARQYLDLFDRTIATRAETHTSGRKQAA